MTKLELDLSVEALVINEKYKELFTKDERKIVEIDLSHIVI